MAERGLNLTSLSALLGISRGTLRHYFNNPEKIPYEIVSKIAETLCDNSDEAIQIFFADNLRNTQVITTNTEER